MAIIEEALLERSRFVRGHLYVRPPEPVHFPAFDEEPVGETTRHLDIRTALHLLMKSALAATATIGSDQFVYWNRREPRRCVCPDVFVKLGVPHAHFDVWKTWERGTPEVAVEILSDSDREEGEWEEKLDRYRASGIPELVSFDHQDAARPIRVWDDVDGDLVERAANDPDLRFCQALGLWWATVPEAGLATLRLARDREGRDLLPTLEDERARAQEEIERLKAELETMRAGRR